MQLKMIHPELPYKNSTVLVESRKEKRFSFE
jgi:hypothetical protein